MCSPTQLNLDACNAPAKDIPMVKEGPSETTQKQNRSSKPKNTRKKNTQNKKSINKGKKQQHKKGQKQNKKQQQPKEGCEQQELTLEEKGRYIALDCEFVGVGHGGYESALARVSIVDWNNAVLLDTYVKVDEPVTDYRTFVSGIREEHLESDIAMDAEKCIELVKKILKGKILVGHGLNCDLGVMGIQHPWYATRDTAKYEPFMKKEKSGKGNTAILPFSMMPKPRKLKDLALTKLKRTIQKEGESHCSIEDAIAALDLYKKARGKWEKVMEYKISRTHEIECEHQQPLHEE